MITNNLRAITVFPRVQDLSISIGTPIVIVIVRWIHGDVKVNDSVHIGFGQGREKGLDASTPGAHLCDGHVFGTEGHDFAQLLKTGSAIKKTLGKLFQREICEHEVFFMLS